ncbi:MAG TPA: inner membrane CreD family protein [Polyangiaceae bacterium]|jgi:inner membrane protein involved in colicin E2 resistance|nr:MAG: inner membrane protein [Deltaproteobacteria bacterium ADurb.Bin207]HNZ25534.1 inner membrane CreD family protein [Polyangiaceae bacterium]HOD25613.1 inner membrane CreD family protein [Polyangiaceae bacterium]HOE51859.1 inner membrane CreD family protein [Polyangiaceae bacterium]HOH03785.1 inner membrane CreD family protein [Polyangiaceae bacterium]
MKRLLAIGVIWLGCLIAWVILGSTIVFRSDQSSMNRYDDVALLWGPALQQEPPSAVYTETKKVRESRTTTGMDGTAVVTDVEKQVEQAFPLTLAATDIQTSLHLEHRRKGLLWFPTYTVDFSARYAFVNETDAERRTIVRFPLGQTNTIFEGFGVQTGDGQPVEVQIEAGVAWWNVSFAPGQRREYKIAYRSRGTNSWHYQLTAGTGRVNDFRLTMQTNFSEIDFPAGTLSPSEHGVEGDGWKGTWQFNTLVANAPIGVSLPQLLNPGPLASKITFFAPVGLLFFFFVVAVFAAAHGKNLHPLHYFYFGCAFFAFHLLFAYLVDHVAIAPAFAIASGVSILLVVTYARLFVGWKYAAMFMGIPQLLYLVLFSFTFFWEGFTGLSITCGAILTLFVMMQFTGRLSWRGLSGTPNSNF